MQIEADLSNGIRPSVAKFFNFEMQKSSIRSRRKP